MESTSPEEKATPEVVVEVTVVMVTVIEEASEGEVVTGTKEVFEEETVMTEDTEEEEVALEVAVATTEVVVVVEVSPTSNPSMTIDSVETTTGARKSSRLRSLLKTL